MELCEQDRPQHASFHLGGPRHVQEGGGAGEGKVELGSVGQGTAAVDHRDRAKAREKRRQLKEVAGQFGTTHMEDYLNMIIRKCIFLLKCLIIIMYQ